MRESKIKLEELEKFSANGYSLKEVADYYGCKYQGIQSFLKSRDIKLEFKRHKKIDTKDDFFRSINSELKAYLLGFFYADGCIYSKNRFGLCLAETDEYIIDLFKRAIAPTSFIKRIHNEKGAENRKPQLVIRIQSEAIVNDLIKLGINKRKTDINFGIPDIEDEFKSHFIRGYFDGDGCFSLHGEKKVYNRVSIVNSTPKILEDIKDVLEKEGIKTNKINDFNTYYTFTIERKLDTSLFFNYIYNNATYFLSRKKNKFNQRDNTVLSTENNKSVTV